MTTSLESVENAKLRYLGAAKTEQVVKELEAKGYTVQLDVPSGSDPNAPRFDILARRGEETLVVEIKVAGTSKSTAEQIAYLRSLARTQGIDEFQVVVAHPPPTVVAEVEGLEAELERYLTDHMPESLISDFPHARLEEVSDIDLDELTVGADEINVAGEGLIAVTLVFGGGEERDGLDIYERFPFQFTATLNGARRIVTADVTVDTSSWWE